MNCKTTHTLFTYWKSAFSCFDPFTSGIRLVTIGRLKPNIDNSLQSHTIAIVFNFNAAICGIDIIKLKINFICIRIIRIFNQLKQC